MSNVTLSSNSNPNSQNLTIPKLHDDRSCYDFPYSSVLLVTPLTQFLNPLGPFLSIWTIPIYMDH